MWALRFSLLYAILRMNPDLVPANGTLEFPKPWNQSAVLFLFSDKYRLICNQLLRIASRLNRAYATNPKGSRSTWPHRDAEPRLLPPQRAYASRPCRSPGSSAAPPRPCPRFSKKGFSGSGYFPQLGNFHLGCCYSHFHMLYYEGTLDGLQQTGRLSSLSGGAILGFVFCFAGDFASARLTFL